MLISTKGRYALRVMIDLAEHQTDGYIPLKEVAQRQDIYGRLPGAGFLSRTRRSGLCQSSGMPHFTYVAGSR